MGCVSSQNNESASENFQQMHLTRSDAEPQLMGSINKQSDIILESRSSQALTIQSDEKDFKEYQQISEIAQLGQQDKKNSVSKINGSLEIKIPPDEYNQNLTSDQKKYDEMDNHALNIDNVGISIHKKEQDAQIHTQRDDKYETSSVMKRLDYSPSSDGTNMQRMDGVGSESNFSQGTEFKRGGQESSQFSSVGDTVLKRVEGSGETMKTVTSMVRVGSEIERDEDYPTDIQSPKFDGDNKKIRPLSSRHNNEKSQTLANQGHNRKKSNMDLQINNNLISGHKSSSSDEMERLSYHSGSEQENQSPEQEVAKQSADTFVNAIFAKAQAQLNQ